MSLSAHERQALETIEDSLAGSDPKLASMLATFNRLAAGEEMPTREETRAGGLPSVGYRRHQRRVAVTWTARRGTGGQWARPLLLLLAVVVVVVATAVIALEVSRSGERACTGSFALACAGQARTQVSRPATGRAPARLAPRTTGMRRREADVTIGEPGAHGAAPVTGARQQAAGGIFLS